MKRVLAFLLIVVLLAGAVGTSAFAAPGNSGKVHWKDALIKDWDAMMTRYLELKDIQETRRLGVEESKEFEQLKADLTPDSKDAKKFYLALRNHMHNKHYQPQVQNTVRVMNQFRNRFPNWDVLPFSSIVSHKYNFLFDTPPMIANGRTLVPVRALVEALDAYLDVEVEWIPYYGDNTKTFGDYAGFSHLPLVDVYNLVDGNQTADDWLDDEMNKEVDQSTEVSVVRITVDDLEIALFIDYPVAYINDNGVIRWEALDTQPQVFSDRTYVPLRFIVETLDLVATWDDGTIVIDDPDNPSDPDDPVVPSNIVRDSDEVIQLPFTLGEYRLDVDFYPSSYDVDIRIIDELQNPGLEPIPYYVNRTFFTETLNGYYLGLAIEVPEEVADLADYNTDDVIDVEWRGHNVAAYQVLSYEDHGKMLYVYVKINPGMVGTSPNLEVKWEDGLDREYFDVHLKSLAFESVPVTEEPVVRTDDEIVQYNGIGGLNLDFTFVGASKALDIDGKYENSIPYLVKNDPPSEGGNYVGLRIPAPEGFVLEDFEYVTFNDVAVDEDDFVLAAGGMGFYLKVNQEDQSTPQKLLIKWGPTFEDDEIFITWSNLNLKNEILIAERTAGSVVQDTGMTGGEDLAYEFNLGEMELDIHTIGTGAVSYYVASEGSLALPDGTLLNDGNWVGIEIQKPVNYTGTEVKKLTVVEGVVEIYMVENFNLDSGAFVYYYKVDSAGDKAFDIQIQWDTTFEEEVIHVDATFDDLAQAPTE